MITETLVKTLAEQCLEGTDHFVVDVIIRSGNRISVLIDGDHRVTIDSCTRVSRFIEGQFDRDKEDFELTVSSSGADRPLKMARQYKKNIGFQLELILQTGDKLTGTVIDADDLGVVIEKKAEKKSKKETEPSILTYKYAEIKSAKEVITFKK